MNFHALVHCLYKYPKKTRIITIHTLHTSFSRSTPYNPEDKTEKRKKSLLLFRKRACAS